MISSIYTLWNLTASSVTLLNTNFDSSIYSLRPHVHKSLCHIAGFCPSGTGPISPLQVFNIQFTVQ